MLLISLIGEAHGEDNTKSGCQVRSGTFFRIRRHSGTPSVLCNSPNQFVYTIAESGFLAHWSVYHGKDLIGPS